MIALVQAAGLWASTAKTGRTVLAGRWGGCRVLVIENDRATEADGEPTHLLMLGDAEHGRQPEPAQRVDQDAGDGTPGIFYTDNARPRAGGRPVTLIFQTCTRPCAREREARHGD